MSRTGCRRSRAKASSTSNRSRDALRITASRRRGSTDRSSKGGVRIGSVTATLSGQSSSADRGLLGLIVGIDIGLGVLVVWVAVRLSGLDAWVAGCLPGLGVLVAWAAVGLLLGGRHVWGDKRRRRGNQAAGHRQQGHRAFAGFALRHWFPPHCLSSARNRDGEHHHLSLRFRLFRRR